MSTDVGLNAFDKALLQKESQVIIMDGEGKKIRKILSYNTENVTEKIESLSEIPIDDLLNKVQKDLLKSISEILKIKEQDIDIESELGDFGFDSISFTQFSNELNKKYNLNIMPSIFFEYPTLNLFANYLIKEYKDDLLQYYGQVLNIVKKSNAAFTPKEDIVEHKPRFIQSNYKQEIVKANKINEPIAIIGMAGVMPQSPNLETFWDNLINGVDMISEIPKDRWNWEDYTDQTKVKYGGFMSEVDKFDPLFFGISPCEAELTDPQQRIFLGRLCERQ